MSQFQLGFSLPCIKSDFPSFLQEKLLTQDFCDQGELRLLGSAIPWNAVLLPTNKEFVDLFPENKDIQAHQSILYIQYALKNPDYIPHVISTCNTLFECGSTGLYVQNNGLTLTRAEWDSNSPQSPSILLNLIESDNSIQTIGMEQFLQKDILLKDSTDQELLFLVAEQLLLEKKEFSENDLIEVDEINFSVEFSRNGLLNKTHENNNARGVLILSRAN